MNIANKLTLFRVLLVPVFVGSLLMFGIESIIPFLIFVIASLTDMLDGYLARSRNLITTFGKFMDPLADKILACSALIMLIQFNKVDAWMVCIVLAREFIISGFRILAASDGVVIAASIYGKFKTITQLIAISLILINSSGIVNIPFKIDIILWYISVGLTVISAVDYIYKNIKVLDLKNI
ncbi:MAG: CDP-diacylglycerol--glycerol-3-phosphate 3-phosphatidyltransferase [Peptoniphilaceae bacterium]|uniref:CDP-diacylglycerol--glycerol-3-phosphate 3-phosphatidyltransferase n=1 Tax=Parvimonas sp. TaxID=1944660 RepID=UPI0025CF7E1B|nr:CDP-diacylglycerol--glycerol-3-phosphate 3-phosphatidyltransferase [Parvimonas sp.]MCI5997245.1 CDP-diacylglycerol--glycerol-3-phosphate 3-phosphatidyltransferase [Parvimonas sp.]MDD7764359.1 CDP-diacylglycerol--glycerol-3-phosphate 3-phosphatidyltransferase [Peptoniphilaceae bacterium]MDY3050055.1 CDP-diacylglycerol--glycerol-3-phosphate 3-phosphatidyltransferase [Parvimonas sp.]